MQNDSTVYEKPPTKIKEIYKTIQKASWDPVLDFIDFDRITPYDCHLLRQPSSQSLPTELCRALLEILASDYSSAPAICSYEPPEVFEATSVPGLFVYPSLLPPEVQIKLLDKLFHRDLCNPEHKTNVHLHHHVPCPAFTDDGLPLSYFDSSSRNLTFVPKDLAIHKPFNTQQYLDKKLRWMTLGGQYDWTNKVYPSAPPPPFPLDIKRLIEDLFPMKAEAAIVNLYSPGDTLSLHRDVSEGCNQPLVSISIGCDGIFVIGVEGANDNGEPRVATIRLRSGDAVLMSGESRFAWHGVPKVLEGTCPEWLQDWPFDPTNEEHDCDGRFEHWKVWMKGKRVNLNVRQMFA